MLDSIFHIFGNENYVQIQNPETLPPTPSPSHWSSTAIWYHGYLLLILLICLTYNVGWSARIVIRNNYYCLVLVILCFRARHLVSEVKTCRAYTGVTKHVSMLNASPVSSKHHLVSAEFGFIHLSYDRFITFYQAHETITIWNLTIICKTLGNWCTNSLARGAT